MLNPNEISFESEEFEKEYVEEYNENIDDPDYISDKYDDFEMLDISLIIDSILPKHQAVKIGEVYPDDEFWLNCNDELFTIIGYHYPLKDEGSKTAIYRINHINIERYAFDYFKANYEL